MCTCTCIIWLHTIIYKYYSSLNFAQTEFQKKPWTLVNAFCDPPVFEPLVETENYSNFALVVRIHNEITQNVVGLLTISK